MSNRPLLRSLLVWALAKRTLLASSSALLRSSAVRSGARLNINGSVYHRRERLGQSSSPPNLTSFTDAIAPPLTVSPCLVPVAARLHGTPLAGSALGVVVVRPTAVLGGADLYPCPCPLRGGDNNVGEDPSQCPPNPTLCTRERGPPGLVETDDKRQLVEAHPGRGRPLLSLVRIGRSGRTKGVSHLYGESEILRPYRFTSAKESPRGEPVPEPRGTPQSFPLRLRLSRVLPESLQIDRIEKLVDEPHLLRDLALLYALVHPGPPLSSSTPLYAKDGLTIFQHRYT